ncbi:MAG TPA: PmoA family protein [Opitutaceae bacterium]|nr:PmoA family protein [Opitutaceae bacterium]
MRATRGLFLVSVVLVPVLAFAQRVVIEPEAFDRAAQVVEVTLHDPAPTHAVVRGSDGRIHPAHSKQSGHFQFLVEAQKAGETLTFDIVAGSQAVNDQVVVNQGEKAIHVSSDGQRMLSYQSAITSDLRSGIDPIYYRSGYLHPIFTPAGKIVTDDYGERNTHQHGIWTAWSRTEFQGRSPNFWDPKPGTGRIEFDRVERVWNSSIASGFRVRHRYLDLQAPEGKRIALYETWDVQVLPLVTVDGSQAHVFDIIVTQNCATDDPLIVGEYRYGGLGVRGRSDWLKRENMRVLTDRGETDRVKANAQKTRWVVLGGVADGGQAAIALLDHPGNFRSPQAVRVNENLPFICYAPTQEGAWRIEPGKPYVARYRVVVEDQVPAQERVEAFWRGYATAPRVSVR